ncbi:hypothetical protein [Paenibacillus sp. NPDC055715]
MPPCSRRSFCHSLWKKRLYEGEAKKTMKKVIQIVPQLDSPVHALFQFGGVMGERLEANQRNWLMVAPIANPSMVEMFRDRDKPGGDPSCRLLWWSGEFAGKYLTSGVMGFRISRDPHLRETLQSFVDELNRYQAPDGYLGLLSIQRAQLSTHLLAGESPVAGGAKPLRS